jgi:hypothetical protein
MFFKSNIEWSVYITKQCIIKKVIPVYTRTKVPHTSPVSVGTQYKAPTVHIRDKIRFLYNKKVELNTKFYTMHLRALTEWGTLWDTISESIH